MPYNEMTLGDLRAATKDMPDNTVLVIYPSDEDFRSCEGIVQKDRDTGERKRVPGRPASVWNFNTRFVRNIHGANDDRLQNSQVVVICIGEPLP